MECKSYKSPGQFSDSQMKKKPHKRKCVECTSSMNTKTPSGKGSKKKKRRQTKKAKKKKTQQTKKAKKKKTQQTKKAKKKSKKKTRKNN